MALAMGGLIGIERERRKGEGKASAAAGLRTFALLCLLGGLAEQSHYELLVFLGAAFTAAAALLGYWLGDRRDPGLTTEVAMFATFLLGVEAQRDAAAALALAVLVTVLLTWRDSLHRLARNVLSEQELHNALFFAIAALVVLPLLPNHTVDPFGLFNPFAFWRVAVVMMGLSAGGHAAARIIGPRYGMAVAGFASGFVSSSATIAVMGGRSRADQSPAVTAASGAAASTLGALVYLATLVAAVDSDLLLRLAVPLASAATVTAVYVFLLSIRQSSDAPPPVLSGTAFGVRAMLIFSAFLGVFSLAESLAFQWFGAAGVFASAVITGAIDVHAAATATATLVANGKTSLSSGYVAVLFALTANMLVKVPLSFATGSKGFGFRVSMGLMLLMAALWFSALTGWQQ